jgi:hypothetical protein
MPHLPRLSVRTVYVYTAIVAHTCHVNNLKRISANFLFDVPVKDVVIWGKCTKSHWIYLSNN